MMNGRILKAILLLLVLLVACFTSAPVLSGENPWDSDRGDDGDGDPPPDTTTNGVDTTVVVPDSSFVSGGSSGSGDITVSDSGWLSFWAGAWSALTAAF